MNTPTEYPYSASEALEALIELDKRTPITPAPTGCSDAGRREPTDAQIKAAVAEMERLWPIWTHNNGRAPEVCRAILVAALALPHGEAGRWREIESAPRDGTPIILGAINPSWAAEGWFCEDDSRWYEAGAYPTDATDGELFPTHWQHLPSPPEGSPDDAGTVAQPH